MRPELRGALQLHGEHSTGADLSPERIAHVVALPVVSDAGILRPFAAALLAQAVADIDCWANLLAQVDAGESEAGKRVDKRVMVWREGRNAYRWLFGASPTNGITLSDVVDVLCVDPEALRRALWQEFSERVWNTLQLDGEFHWWKLLRRALKQQQTESEPVAA